MTNKTISLTDLNTADEDVLAQKLQVSIRIARRIITLRPYQTVDQLNKVWGIEPAVLQRIISLVSVSQHEIISEPIDRKDSSFATKCALSR